MVKSIVAIDGPRVRFAADAFSFFFHFHPFDSLNPFAGCIHWCSPTVLTTGHIWISNHRSGGIVAGMGCKRTYADGMAATDLYLWNNLNMGKEIWLCPSELTNVRLPSSNIRWAIVLNFVLVLVKWLPLLCIKAVWPETAIILLGVPETGITQSLETRSVVPSFWLSWSWPQSSTLDTARYRY